MPDRYDYGKIRAPLQNITIDDQVRPIKPDESMRKIRYTAH